MDILRLAAERVLLLDGGMGTTLLQRRVRPADFGDRPGCNEYLVVSAPALISDIHRAFLAAGCDIVETNTFGANPQTLTEFGLAGRTEELNATAARLARAAAAEAASAERPRFVAGSIGPGAKLATLGQIGYRDLRAGYRRQIDGLLAGGVDLLLVETCQDLLQIKAAVAAARDAMAAAQRALPLWVSVTIESSGTLLTGPDVGAVVAALGPLGVDVLGLNCGTGPQPMRPHLEELARAWPGLLGVYPNAGLPRPCAGGLCYPEGPAELATALGELLLAVPLAFLGGCCGTTPEHIAALAGLLAAHRRDARRRRRRARPAWRPALASTFGAVALRQEPAPLLIGERANATGSKSFRRALLARDFEAAFAVLTAQEAANHALDLSVAYAGFDEVADLRRLAERAGRELRLPLVLDSTNPAALEAALERTPGRPLINSINLEDGGPRAAAVLDLARRFGAAVIALTIDEQGMALTLARKLAVARRLVALAAARGLAPHDLLIDCLTFTIASGDPALRDAAAQTLAALPAVKRELGVGTVLGVSNVSYGLAARGRQVLNSVFLHEAVAAGLDAALLDPGQILPLAQLAPDDVRAALDLLHDRRADGDPPERFIRRTSGAALAAAPAAADLPPAEAARQAILAGRVQPLGPALTALRAERSPEAIVADLLVPAMREVGELFGRGKLQLPFVLASAQAMQHAVGLLAPHFTRAIGEQRRRLLLATVRGDVHDIGKNLVAILVGNNGFAVSDLGTKVPVERLIAAVREQAPDAIGLSGLLVSSAVIMAEDLRALDAAGIRVPVLVGGAALTADFVASQLAPAYPHGRVLYCPDAFAGLRAMQALEPQTPAAVARSERPTAAPHGPRPPTAGSGAPTPGNTHGAAASSTPTVRSAHNRLTSPGQRTPIASAAGCPRLDLAPAARPPFLGSRVGEHLRPDELWPLLDERRLFVTRWGYRRAALAPAEHERLLASEARPRLAELRRLVATAGTFQPAYVYGWFEGRGQGDRLLVSAPATGPRPGRELRFDFPRRAHEPRLCIADFVRPDSDAVGFFVATLGPRVAEHEQRLLASGDYLRYMLLHGLAVEATEALAELVHARMRAALVEPGAASPADAAGGARYGFGYPACPDLAAQALVFELLDPARIGVALSESFQLHPELSTSALVLHQPQARYFAI